MQWVNAWVPHWVVGIVVMVVPALIALFLYRWFSRGLARLAARFSPFLQQLLIRGQGPASALIVIIVLGVALPGAPLSSPVKIGIAHGLVIAFVLALGWVAAIALNLGADFYMHRFRMDTPDNLLARKHVTQVNILRRAALTLLVMLTISTALMTIDAVRQYGVSLLASAGAAGIVVGLAARPVFSNLLAGIQIAITQPIRVEDAVVVEGQWGWIETITSTYVVVRIWDLRRLVLPLTYFIEKPFENWTYQGSELLRPIMLNVDYTVPVDRLRQKLDEIVHSTKLWDGKVVVLQVTDTPENMVQLRALVSARDSGQGWDLQCYVREKLIAFLQEEYPHALPRQRTELVGMAEAIARMRRPAERAEPETAAACGPARPLPVEAQADTIPPSR